MAPLIDSVEAFGSVVKEFPEHPELLELFHSVATSVSCAELTFVPDSSVADFVMPWIFRGSGSRPDVCFSTPC